MISNKNLNKIKFCARKLEQYCNKGNVPKVFSQLNKNYRIITKVAFSDINGADSNSNHKSDILVLHDAKPIMGIDKANLSEKEKEIINFRQNYLDDLDSINSSNNNALTKVKESIKEYIYIYFDIQNKAKRFEYEFSEKQLKEKPSKYSPRILFQKKFNKKRNLILLNINLSMIGLLDNDTDSKHMAVITYIPKQCMKEWKHKND